MTAVPYAPRRYHQAEQRSHNRRFQTGATAYNQRRWVRFSQRYRAEHPFCINADKGLAHCTGMTEITDHITPHNGNEQQFWAGPFQPMCRSCHSVKTRAEVWTI